MVSSEPQEALQTEPPRERRDAEQPTVLSTTAASKSPDQAFLSIPLEAVGPRVLTLSDSLHKDA